MQQVDKFAIVDDIEVEYKKLFDECKKKHTETKEGIERGLGILDKMHSLSKKELEIELNKAVDPLLSPIIMTSEKKISRLYVSSLTIIKKLLSYGLIKQKHSQQIIDILKDILANSSEEFVQLKVIETLLPMVNPAIIQLSEKLIENILSMSLKFFSFKSNVFKNPLNVLLRELMTTVYGFLDSSLRPVIDKGIKAVQIKTNFEPKPVEESTKEESKDKSLSNDKTNANDTPSKNENASLLDEGKLSLKDMKEQMKENDMSMIMDKRTSSVLCVDLSEYEDTEVYKSAFLVFTTVCDLCEGIKGHFAVSPTVYSKCLGYELLSTMISITNDLFIYLPHFIDRIKVNLNAHLLKVFASNYDYVTCTKITRLTVKMTTNLCVGYNLIPLMIKYAEGTTVNWQKQIGVESICELLSSKRLLADLFLNEEIYSIVINSLTKVSYEITLNKKAAKEIDGNKIVNIPKLIANAQIFTDMDVTPPVSTFTLIFGLVVDSYKSLHKTYTNLIVDNGLKLNQKNTFEFTTEQRQVKDVITYKNEVFLSAMIALIQSTSDDVTLDIFMTLFVDFIRVYGAINLTEIRDLYLKEISDLIGNETNQALNEKVMKTIFSIAEQVNVLDTSGFVMVIQAIQKIYLKIISSSNSCMLKPTEEFELDVYIQNIENIISKNTKLKVKSILGKSNENTPQQQQNHNQKIPNDQNQIEIENEKEEEDLEDKKEDEQIDNALADKDTTKKVQKKPKGIFSKLKSAFGFSKKKSNEVRVTPEKEREIITFLTEKTEKIYFVNSDKYSNDVIIELVTALFDSSKKLCDDPGEYNVVECLHFNLIKFLELSIINYKRIHLIWDIFITTALEIASKQIETISHFAIDVITMAVMFLLSLISNTKQEDFPKLYAQSEAFTFDNWQRKIVSSLKQVSEANISQDINLNIIYDLSVLLVNAAYKLNPEGWSCLIETFQAQVDKRDEAQCEHCFILLEQIFNQYFSQLSPNNICSISNILEVFVSYNRNENISNSAIQLFVTLCNLCEKFEAFTYVENITDCDAYHHLTPMQKAYFNSKLTTIISRKEFFDSMWRDVFSKMLTLSLDDRPAIRRNTINAFRDIFISKNTFISPEMALDILNNNFFEVFDKVNAKYEAKLKVNRKMIQMEKEKSEDKSTKSQQPSFKQKNEKELNESLSQTTTTENTFFKFGDFQVDQLKLPEKKKNIKFDDTKLSKPTDEELSWELTLKESINALSSTIAAYLQTNPNLGFKFYKENIYLTITTKFSKVMRFNSPIILIEILNSLSAISKSYTELYYKNIDMFWSIYAEMGKFIQTEYFLSTFARMSTDAELVSKILKHLDEMFLNDAFLKINPDLLSDRNFEQMVFVLAAVIASSYSSEGNNVIDFPWKLLYEESKVFDFAFELQKKIINNQKSLVTYAKFLSKYLSIEFEELHSEALCRKSLEMFIKFYSDPQLLEKFLLSNLPGFITQVRDLMCMRNKSEYVSILLKNKAEKQLWSYASTSLIKVIEYAIVHRKYSSHSIVNPIWASLISAYESVFRQSETGYKAIPKAQQEELIKSCQEMEISIINFIVRTLLPHSLHIPKEMQIKLLTLLDMGSNFDYNVSNVSSSTSAITSSISKVCISNLFDLCKYKTQEILKREIENFNPEDYVKIKIKIAKMCTPILIKRCKDALKKFLDDEIKSGSMPLSRSRLEDIKFVLEKLKDLEVYPNYHLFEEEDKPKEVQTCMLDFILMKKKSHLISLLPLLSEFITTKENEIKIIVKEIFRIISDEIGIK